MNKSTYWKQAITQLLPVNCRSHGQPKDCGSFNESCQITFWSKFSNIHFNTMMFLVTLMQRNYTPLVLCITVIAMEKSYINHTTTTTILRPFFQDHPGEPVPDENFWTVRCKGRLTETDTLTIRLGVTPSGLTSAPPPSLIFFMGRMPFLPPNQHILSLLKISTRITIIKMTN